jgi:hypothetical protein
MVITLSLYLTGGGNDTFQFAGDGLTAWHKGKVCKEI